MALRLSSESVALNKEITMKRLLFAVFMLVSCSIYAQERYVLKLSPGVKAAHIEQLGWLRLC
jgi:hypothetical protein